MDFFFMLLYFEIVLTQEIAKTVQSSPILFAQLFPMIMSYITLLKSRNEHWYNTLNSTMDVIFHKGC